jgi:hypothetical protein
MKGDAMRKTLTVIAVAAAMTIAVVAAPDQAEARRGRIAASIIGGFAAGAIIGTVVGNGGYYYGPGYGPGYYAPGYYGPAPYAYVPAPVYVQPVPRNYRGGSCWIETDSSRGYGYYGPCY